MKRAAFAMAIAVTVVFSVRGAEAQSSSPPDPKKVEEAKSRFTRGLQLYEEKNFEAACIEFERANDLAPSWRLFYNIGLCYGVRGDYVEAVRYLERYAAEGAGELTKERADQVQKELTNLRPRIARLTVRVNEEGAEIQVDDQKVGVSPLPQPLPVNPGKRKVGVLKQGFFPASSVLTLASSESQEVVLELKPVPKEYVDQKNPYVGRTIIAWGATAAVLVGAGVASFFASQAEDDLEKKRRQLDVTKSELSDGSSNVQTLAVVADAGWILSAVGAGIGTYFTVQMLGWKPGTVEANPSVGTQPRVQVGAGPTSVSVFGSF